MKRFIAIPACALCVAFVLHTPTIQAQETVDVSSMSMAEMLAFVEQLTTQIQELQAQLTARRGELQAVREEIRTHLREGARGEEVSKLQELLATDEMIYPERLVTGYFGPLTRQALSRLQQRHNLSTTGELDDHTRDLINQYFEERQNRSAPEGLLRAPGIREAVERGVCDRGRGNRPFCPPIEDTLPDVDDDKVLRTCGLNVFSEFIGTTVEEEDIITLWEEYHDEEATVRSVRILEPGDAATMDFVETRVNIYLDEDGEVERVTCG